MITYINPKEEKRKQRRQDLWLTLGAIAFFLLLLIGTAPANR